MKDKYNPNWEKAAEIDGNVTSGKVKGLEEGNRYEFRVRAVNKGGPGWFYMKLDQLKAAFNKLLFQTGEPSLPTAPHVARAKNSPPKIDQSAMHPIKIKAGQNFEFEVPVSGEPPPTKEWALNDSPLFPDEHLKVTNEDYSTKLKVLNARRGDSGVYTLTAKNKNGTDVATVNVIVLDVPSPPKSLQVDDVSKNGCKLKWTKPVDDGGSDILHYVVEKMDLENMRWLPVGEASGTSIKVDKLIPDHDYKFRVKAGKARLS